MLGVRPNTGGCQLMGRSDFRELMQVLRMSAGQEGCSQMVENRGGVRKLIDKGKSFQAVNLVRTLVESP